MCLVVSHVVKKYTFDDLTKGLGEIALVHAWGFEGLDRGHLMSLCFVTLCMRQLSPWKVDCFAFVQPKLVSFSLLTQFSIFFFFLNYISI